MNFMTLYYIAMSYFVFGVIMFMVIPLYSRCGLKRKLRKKNYGVVEIMGKGGEIIRYIEDFSKDTTKHGGGEYSIDPDYVYKKSGVPCIHFNAGDLQPVSFIKGLSDDKYRNPQFIANIFMKQKSLAEAKVLMDEKKLWAMLMMCVVLSAIGAVVSYMALQSINEEIVPFMKDMRASGMTGAGGSITIGNASYPIVR